MTLLQQIKFQYYYQKYFKKIYNYVYFRVGQNHYLAEDLTQEIFIQAFEHFDQFNEKNRFCTWLYTIAKNKTIDHYRKKQIEKVDLEDVDNTNAVSINAQETFIKEFEHNLEFTKIKQKLKKLSQTDQEIIILRYINDLEINEISEIMKKDANYIRVNLHRAIKKLSNLSMK